MARNLKASKEDYWFKEGYCATEMVMVYVYIYCILLPSFCMYNCCNSSSVGAMLSCFVLLLLVILKKIN